MRRTPRSGGPPPPPSKPLRRPRSAPRNAGRGSTPHGRRARSPRTRTARTSRSSGWCPRRSPGHPWRILCPARKSRPPGYREGRISREAYESNLAKFEIAPPPPEGRRAALRRAFDEGKISRALYARNLVAQLEVAEDPQGGALIKAFTDGKIDADPFEGNTPRRRPR